MAFSQLVRTSLPAGLALAAAAAALGPGSARAVILRSGGSAEADARLAAEARREGLDLKGVAGLVVAGAGGTGIGSATYLGAGQDGTTGLLLTAAHLFGEKTGTPDFVQIAFGPGIGLGTGGLQLPATGVILHPDYRIRGDGTAMGAKGDPARILVIEHDLAVVTFDMARWGEALAKAGVRPIPLYEGTGYTAPLLSALVAGYGQSGHAGGGRLTPAGLLHAGRTRVSHATVNGQAAFHAWLPVAEGKADAESRDAEGWFIRESGPAGYGRLDGKDTVQVQTHAGQAAASTGDSGGPMLFNGKGGVLRLAGVFSSSRGEWFTAEATGQETLLVHQVFQSVPDHWDWITAVQAGKPGKSKVITFGPAVGGGSTAGAKVETKAETKVETKGDGAAGAGSA